MTIYQGDQLRKETLSDLLVEILIIHTSLLFFLLNFGKFFSLRWRFYHVFPLYALVIYWSIIFLNYSYLDLLGSRSSIHSVLVVIDKYISVGFALSVLLYIVIPLMMTSLFAQGDEGLLRWKNLVFQTQLSQFHGVERIYV